MDEESGHRSSLAGLNVRAIEKLTEVRESVSLRL